MSSMNINKDRLITGGIIVLAVIGITYFGFNAFSGTSGTEKPNPYEYNIEYYKQNDPALNHYTELKQIPVNMQKITGIAIGPGEELYVSGDNLYLRLDQDGNISTTVKSGQTAMCLSIDQNKDVYLGMTDHVQVFNQDGILKDRWQSPGEKSLITSISVTSHHVYVADAGNFIVWQYDKMGELIKRIGEKDKSKDIPGFIIPSPYFDLAVDPDGFLWVANPGRLSLENYSKDGNIRSSWGTPGMKIEEFCGCCNPSHFTIFEDGSFVTSEKGIARVKVYNRLGQLTSVVAGPDQFTEGTVGLDLAVDSKNRIYVLDPTRKMVRIFEKKTEQRAT
jgi:DNA-binding beta-propeller fold protein YncE